MIPEWWVFYLRARGRWNTDCLMRTYRVRRWW